MTFSWTGLAYLATLLSTSFLAYRFFQYWRKERSVVAEFLFYFMAVFNAFFIVVTFPTLFFADNVWWLKFATISTSFLEGLACAFLGYLIFYLWFKNISPWFGFAVPFVLGVIATVLLLVSPPNPFLEKDLVVNWGELGPADVLRSLIYLITFLPLIFILAAQYRRAENSYAKTRALGMFAVFAFAIVVILMDYGIENFLHLRQMTSDISQIVLSVFLFVFLLTTQKAPPAEKDLPIGYSRVVR
ncbi:MAG: hypothetical protein HY443_01840 [Candidatus Nealsonbacteria bacterium]|nr:hypothetical protein [Candidatus Nealsonbacteria bacterium]